MQERKTKWDVHPRPNPIFILAMWSLWVMNSWHGSRVWLSTNISKLNKPYNIQGPPIFFFPWAATHCVMGGCKALSPRMEGAVFGGMFPRKKFWNLEDRRCTLQHSSHWRECCLSNYYWNLSNLSLIPDHSECYVPR